ncbi:MAG: sigma 54-interacting transcriptional regulator [Deltaproteobacteria bacterium]|nr:sigma 54-interacting transcriptional regulator [Deltaproteobacteria bacterium]MBW2068078.1 sigma 54-interacting transcriptional regulator [Deltaproteobacteria bacterium]
MKGTILVVDDERNYLIILQELLEEEGYEVFTADNGREALKLAMETDLDVVVTDMKMPGIDGMSFLDQLHKAKPDVPIIMMTAYGTIEKAVEAMKKGAFDYICKPFENEEFLVVVRKALEHYRLVCRNRELTQALEERYQFGNLIGKSAVMQKLYDTIEKIAPSKATVLITGESGTGKELIARAIHFNSPRRDKAFVSINCGAIPETLLESELFGHEKGAFTGAVQRRKGRFEIAHRGTVFLDEVSEMSPYLQVKLLRILQEMEFERVGGTDTIHVDVRVIAASNRDLKEEIKKGRFREDLYYRLNVVHVHVPPLRERKEDIPLLVRHFLDKYGTESGIENIRIARDALKCLMDYDWPGNVRELENVIERAVVLCSGSEITINDLPPEVRMPFKETETVGISLTNDRKQMPLLSERQRRALNFIKEHGYITNKYYAEINKISARQSLRELDDMIAKGVLVRIGKGRGARYVLSELG